MPFPPEVVSYSPKYEDCPPDCPACAWEHENWPRRPAYDVGEQFTYTQRNPWWKFWLPRAERVTGIVTKAWLKDDGTTCVEVA